MAIALQDEYVLCRNWGHQWDTFSPLRRKASWGTLLSLRCSRCSMERHDTIDSMGQLSTREYKQPDGYHHDGRIPIEELRMETFKRLRKMEREIEAIETPQVKRARTTRKAPSTAGHRRTKGNLKVVS